jgi:hypothetical protein
LADAFLSLAKDKRIMKIRPIYSVFYVLLLVACGSTKLIDTNPENIKPVATEEPEKELSGPEGLKAQMPKAPVSIPAFTSSEKVSELMGYLTSDNLKGRDSGSEGIELAAQYIEKHFATHAISPYYKTFRDTLSNFDKPSYNIVGWIEGIDPELKKEFIVVGAHYDHIGMVSPIQGDSIANGANDNASGTTVVMEVARYFGEKNSNKRSLIFALFSAEEKGLLGSRHMAKNMKQAGLNLYVMLNFEMIGVPLRSKKYSLYITGYEKSNLAAISNKYAGESLIGYLPTAKQYGLFQRSDNYDFYKEFQVPSHTYCTFDFTNFDFYHKPGDELSRMDMEHMATTINKMIPVVEGIANAAAQEIKLN